MLSSMFNSINGNKSNQLDNIWREGQKFMYRLYTGWGPEGSAELVNQAQWTYYQPSHLEWTQSEICHSDQYEGRMWMQMLVVEKWQYLTMLSLI